MTLSLTKATPQPKPRSSRHFKATPPEKDRYGLPVARLPVAFSWANWSSHVTGGLPKPEPVTVERITAHIETIESEWADLTAEMARLDAKLIKWDRWLADPRYRHDPRVGDAFQYAHQTNYAIQSTWGDIAERLGIILGCVASLPDPIKDDYVQRYTNRLAIAREQAFLHGKPLISPSLTFATLPPALWALARCAVVIAGCLTPEAIKPPLPRTARMHDVAKQIATQIAEINRFNRYRMEDEER